MLALKLRLCGHHGCACCRYKDEGYNYIVTRTQRGERLLQEVCSQAGRRALTLTDKIVDFDLIRAAQPQHLRKRTQALAKATAAALLGVPTTHYPAGLRTGWSAVALEGRSYAGVLTDLATAFGGATRRLLAGKNRESLELWREQEDGASETAAENDAVVHADGAARACAHLSAVGLGMASVVWVLKLARNNIL
jgi:hypothetical protein